MVEWRGLCAHAHRFLPPGYKLPTLEGREALRLLIHDGFSKHERAKRPKFSNLYRKFAQADSVTPVENANTKGPR